jgi:hypothetical protein
MTAMVRLVSPQLRVATTPCMLLPPPIPDAIRVARTRRSWAMRKGRGRGRTAWRRRRRRTARRRRRPTTRNCAAATSSAITAN